MEFVKMEVDLDILKRDIFDETEKRAREAEDSDEEAKNVELRQANHKLIAINRADALKFTRRIVEKRRQTEGATS
jgi:hypothetical protein